MKTKCSQTDLVCLKCGNITTIFRKISNLKPIGHIKHLWCYKCKKVTEHYEVRDIDTFLYQTQDKNNPVLKLMNKN